MSEVARALARRWSTPAGQEGLSRTIHQVVREGDSPGSSQTGENHPGGPALFDRPWFRSWSAINICGLIVLAMLLPTTYEAANSSNDSLLDTLLWYALIVLLVTNVAELSVRTALLGIGRFVKEPVSLLDLLALVGCVAALASPVTFPGGVTLFRVFRLAQLATMTWRLDGPVMVARSLLYSPKILGQLSLYMLFWTIFFALMGNTN